MKRNHTINFGLTLVILTTIFISGCYFEVPQTTTEVEPAAEQQALEEELTAAIFAYEDAYEAGDMDKIMSYYADDIISAPPGYPMVQGKEAVEAGYREMFETYTLDRDFEILEMDVGEDSGSRLMEWTNVWTPRADGETITEVGHCVFNYEKIDGEWKVVREIWNMEAVTVD
jgi:ketosteroid isomerase-like protein